MPASHSKSAIARRLVGAAAAAFLLAVILGCMSVSFEGRKNIIQHDDQTFSQTGKLEVPAGQELEIY
jgi:type VI protein secretion system component VasF